MDNYGIPPATGINEVVRPYVDTDKTVNDIYQIAKECKSQTAELSKQLAGATPEETAKNIWYWVCENIQYKEDPERSEDIREPARLFSDGFGDCDCFTTFILSCLLNIYPEQTPDIKLIIRIVAYEKQGEFEHVYPVLKYKENEFVIDCVPEVPDALDELKYIDSQDFIIMQTRRLKGASASLTDIKNTFEEMFDVQLDIQQEVDKKNFLESFIKGVIMRLAELLQGVPNEPAMRELGYAHALLEVYDNEEARMEAIDRILDVTELQEFYGLIKFYLLKISKEEQGNVKKVGEILMEPVTALGCGKNLGEGLFSTALNTAAPGAGTLFSSVTSLFSNWGKSKEYSPSEIPYPVAKGILKNILKIANPQEDDIQRIAGFLASKGIVSSDTGFREMLDRGEDWSYFHSSGHRWYVFIADVIRNLDQLVFTDTLAAINTGSVNLGNDGLQNDRKAILDTLAPKITKAKKEVQDYMNQQNQQNQTASNNITSQPKTVTSSNVNNMTNTTTSTSVTKEGGGGGTGTGTGMSTDTTNTNNPQSVQTKEKWYKTTWGIVIIIIVALALIGGITYAAMPKSKPMQGARRRRKSQKRTARRLNGARKTTRKRPARKRTSKRRLSAGNRIVLSRSGTKKRRTKRK